MRKRSLSTKAGFPLPELVEGIGDRVDAAGLDQRAGNVRPAERAAGGELLDAAELDRVAERAERLDHPCAAGLPRLAELAQPLFEALVGRVEGVGEDVHVVAVDDAGELRCRDQRDAALVRVRLDLEVGGDVVVVADGHDGDAALPREIDDLARRARSVGMVGVEMEVGVTQWMALGCQLSALSGTVQPRAR